MRSDSASSRVSGAMVGLGPFTIEPATLIRIHP